MSKFDFNLTSSVPIGNNYSVGKKWYYDEIS